MSIRYSGGYKYQLRQPYTCYVDILPEEEVEYDFITLSSSGVLTIRSAYAWDGPSGPTHDSRSSMRASLVHDALAQLIRRGLLSRHWLPAANRIFHQHLLEDGMWSWRAWLWYRAVVRTAGSWAATSAEREVHEAP